MAEEEYEFVMSGCEKTALRTLLNGHIRMDLMKEKNRKNKA